MKGNRKGITLIGLVVTIVVLLILAGITLSVVLGPNGIIERAKQAVKESKQAGLNEQAYLAELEKAMQIEIAKISDPNPGELEQIDENTYTVNSIEDLVGFSKKVNNGEGYQGKTIILVSTLDFTNDKSYTDPTNTELFGDYNGDGLTEGIKEELNKGRGFIPIGNKVDIQKDAEENITLSGNWFKGTFDGGNKELRNIRIQVDETEKEYGVAGLFGVNNGSIKNLAVSGNISCSNSVEKGRVYIGSISGYSFGNIANCYNTSNIINGPTYLAYLGGITGIQSGANKEVTNCINKGAVICQNALTGGTVTVGGVIGYNYGSYITKVENQVKIMTQNAEGLGTIFIGGVIGENTGSLFNSNNTGAVEVSQGTADYLDMGGIVGVNRGQIENCANVGSVISKINLTKNLFVAGISGYNYAPGNIIDSVNNGQLVVQGEVIGWQEIAGVAGCNTGTIRNCSNTVNINNTSSVASICVGGIVSVLADGTVENCNNTVEIKATNNNDGKSAYSGGIVGSANGDKNATVKNCNNSGAVILEGTVGNYGYAAGIVASNGAQIQNCNNTGNISSTCPLKTHLYIGGIVGIYNGENKVVSGCKNQGEIYGSNTTWYVFAGGISGYVTKGTITDSTNEAKVTAYNPTGGAIHVGGITSYNYGTVANCNNTAQLVSDSSTASVFCGGITGKNFLEVNNCTNTGKITAKNSKSQSWGNFAGGISGESDTAGKILNCTNNGALSIEGTEAKYGYIGGITAKNSGLIENSQNLVAPTTNVENLSVFYMGGITGYDFAGTIKACKNTAILKHGNTNATYNIYMGGIIGYIYTEKAITINQCANSGNVESLAGGYTCAGGIIGYIYAGANQKVTIEQCANYGSMNLVSGDNCYIGGIVGQGNSLDLKNSFNRGNINTNSASFSWIGGNIGSAQAVGVSNTYNSGTITATGKKNVQAGGIVGFNNGGKIDKTYNIGAVTSTVNPLDTQNNYYVYAGGIAAINQTAGTITNSYNSGTIKSILNGSLGATRQGGILAEQYYDQTLGASTVRNCYYTSASAATGVGQNNNGIVENVVVNNNMPSILSVLGSPFKADPNNANLPILSWQ